MVAAEVLEIAELEEFDPEPYLRLVTTRPTPQPFRHGPSLARRRAARVRATQRRRRVVVGLVLMSALTILALPGHVFGATNSSGLSSDLADSSVLAPGMDYVVQSGDSVSSIAKDVNPVDPSLVRAQLVHQLGSSVVVPGEHVLIP